MCVIARSFWFHRSDWVSPFFLADRLTAEPGSNDRLADQWVTTQYTDRLTSQPASPPSRHMYLIVRRILWHGCRSVRSLTKPVSLDVENWFYSGRRCPDPPSRSDPVRVGRNTRNKMYIRVSPSPLGRYVFIVDSRGRRNGPCRLWAWAPNGRMTKLKERSLCRYKQFFEISDRPIDRPTSDYVRHVERSQRSSQRSAHWASFFLFHSITPCRRR